MRVKKNSENQLVLPQSVLSRFGDTETFVVSMDGDSIILRPVREEKTDTIRERLRTLNLDREHLGEAIHWARNNP